RRRRRDWNPEWHHQGRLGNPLGHYLRGRLHRRIFLWFCITIAMTTMVVLLFSRQFHSGGWPYDRARQFMAGQFAEIWNEPARRDALAAAMSKDLGIGVRLSDASDET